MLTVPLGAAGLAALAPGLPPEAAAVAGAPLRPLHAAPAIATMANRAARRASGVVVLLLTVSPSCSAGASVRDGLPPRRGVSTARDLPRLIIPALDAGRSVGCGPSCATRRGVRARYRGQSSPGRAIESRAPRARSLGDAVEHDPEQDDA